MSEAGRRGRVYKRSGGWAYTVDVAPIGAPRKQQKRQGFATKVAAQAELAEVIRQSHLGGFVEIDRKTTLRVFVENSYLPACEMSLQPATLNSYRRLLRIHLLPRLGDYPIASITTDMIDQLYQAMFRGETSPHGRPLTANTVLHAHNVLNSVFKHAIKKRHLINNPCAAADKPSLASAEPPPRTTWTPTQVRAFLKVTSSDRLHALWVLLATTGMRRGEALGLQWNDVDLDDKVLTIRRAVASIDGAPLVTKLKTRASIRSVQLDDGTVGRLRSHRAAQLEERLSVGPAYEGDWVFARPEGGHLNPNRVSRAFTRTCVKHKIAPIRLHDLRHTWATIALSQGTSPKIVQERLGHANISVTLQIYTHTSRDLHRDAATSVAATFIGHGGAPA